MKNLFTILFSSLFLFSFSQPVFSWAKQLGGVYEARGGAIVVDGSGNVITTGQFSSTADFDPGPGTYTLNATGISDIFVSKLDANGNFLWAKSTGTNTGNLDKGNAIITDVSGNIYVTGTFNGLVDFDPGPGVLNLSSTAGGEVFILKLDANGNFLWAKQTVSNCGVNEGNSISLDAAGNVYTTGRFCGTADFDPGPGTFNITSFGYTDVFVLKLNSLGNFVWAKQMGGSTAGPNGDYGNSIAIDPIGNVYTTGYYMGLGDYDPGPGSFTLATAGQRDAFISKLDANGNFVWAKSIASALSEEGFEIVANASGAYVAGYFNGTVDFDPGPGTFTLSSFGGMDGYVLKLDPSGNFLWAGNTGGTSQDQVKSLALDQTGDVYLVGTLNATADVDPTPTSYTLTSLGGTDIFMTKLSGSGSFMWAAQIGGTSSGESAEHIFIDGSNNIYTTGYFGVAAVDFDPSISTYTLSSPGSFDVFVHKMTQCTPPSAPSNATPISNQSICAGNTASLIATSAGTVNWFATSSSTTILGTGSVLVTPTLTSGTYTYFAEALTCTTSTVRTGLTLTVNPLPTIAASSSTNQLCIGSSATLTASGGTSYTWNPGGNGASIVVNPTVNTTYTVTGTDANGCQNTSVFTQSVTNCSGGVGLNINYINNESIKIYPNPFKNKLNIECSSNSELIEIFNILGGQILKLKTESGTTEINLSEQPNGIYFIRIGASTIKIVKNNY